jgi:hypothetical protein
MAGREDDPYGDDESEVAEEFDQLRERLFQHVSEFADEESIPDEVLPLLLLQLSVSTRIMAYVTAVAKPSGGGLKLDLDRFRRDVDNLVRESKKDADQTVANMMEAMAKAAELDDDDEP